VRPVRPHLAAALALALLAVLALVLPSLGFSQEQAPSGTTLNSYPIEPWRYDRARRCTRGTQVGARALERWMAEQPFGYSWGIYNCRYVENTRQRSLHAEGRALDWHIDMRSAREKRLANRLIARLLATDSRGNPHALARRMGIQEIIYDCKIWLADGFDMSRYGLCRNSPRGRKRKPIHDTIEHKDHIHIGLNWPGARRETSYWLFYADRWLDGSARPTARATSVSRSPSRD
jgi:hypothetical protein